MRAPILVLVTMASVPAALAQTHDDATRVYMACVRRNAELLEVSGDAPQDVARAAISLCQREELAAFNATNLVNSRAANALRDTAVFYGAAQATVARACRVAQRCGLAPLPDSN